MEQGEAHWLELGSTLVMSYRPNEETHTDHLAMFKSYQVAAPWASR